MQITDKKHHICYTVQLKQTTIYSKILKYYAVSIVKQQQTFRRIVTPSESRSTRRQFGLLDSRAHGTTILQIVSNYLPIDMAYTLQQLSLQQRSCEKWVSRQLSKISVIKISKPLSSLTDVAKVKIN
jgi:hypothetical protein